MMIMMIIIIIMMMTMMIMIMIMTMIITIMMTMIMTMMMVIMIITEPDISRLCDDAYDVEFKRQMQFVSVAECGDTNYRCSLCQ
jgi:hypothetical protein